MLEVERAREQGRKKRREVEELEDLRDEYWERLTSQSTPPEDRIEDLR
jgi:hypothetical protein